MIKERFKQVRKALNLTQLEMASKINKGITVFKGYEAGTKTITGGVLLDLQDIFNVSIEWMRTGEGSMFLSNKINEEPNAKYIDVRSLGNQFVEIREFPTVKASAGYGAVICEAESVPYMINARFIENAEKEVIISVVGNSMQPELYENDKILITTDFKYTCNPKKNSLYVIGIGDDVFIKRYKQKRNNELIFISDNKKYEDIKLNINDGSIRIIGKLKQVIREYN